MNLKDKNVDTSYLDTDIHTILERYRLRDSRASNELDYERLNDSRDSRDTEVDSNVVKVGKQEYYQPPLDVDRPMFNLFGIDYDPHKTNLCPTCSKLVGYDSFTFNDKKFYHLQCFHNEYCDREGQLAL